MEIFEGIPTLYVSSLVEWRQWLANNCQTEKAIYLIVYHKKSKVPSVHWHDAIENALCYGWVDSKAKSRDKESCYLKFTPRNKKSKWGKKNKERAQKMIANGLMTEHGQQLIDWAKDTGKWIRTNTKIIYKFYY
ncbi:MAG: YdeI family protein [Salinivirgaceae bacterium]